LVPAGEVSLIAVPAGEGKALLRVYALGARQVEIMGDVTGWEPKSLDRRDRGWELRLTADPGSHHVVVRVDGGAWKVPVNLARLDDELGGTVGLIVIP